MTYNNFKMSAQMPELGSKITLISKADIRYEGRLFTVDPQECTIALANGKELTLFTFIYRPLRWISLLIYSLKFSSYFLVLLRKRYVENVNVSVIKEILEAGYFVDKTCPDKIYLVFFN